ncbi:MAG: hypothetical protein RSB05_03790 [Clostridiales bacterium]
MINLKEELYTLLKNRKDLSALAILKENPKLCDNTVIRLALDNRCFKTISYLRKLDLITLEGKEEREKARIEEINNNIEKFETLMEDVDQYISQHPEDLTWNKKQ